MLTWSVTFNTVGRQCVHKVHWERESNTIAFNPGKEHQTLLYYPLQYVRMYGICRVLSEEQMLLYSTSNSLNVASHSLNTATHTLNVMSHSLSQM